ncbi:zinc-binding dehydrogenase, partial [Cellulomonas hominis]|uniref:zinc-binding dehydrogenase n=1 Tax=Cellulomonas hominis TaxID=156981 RepID=UPI0014440B02
ARRARPGRRGGRRRRARRRHGPAAARGAAVPARAAAAGRRVSRDNPADLGRLRDLLASGDLVPAVERVLPLDQAAAAIDHLASGAARGKVLLAVS